MVYMYYNDHLPPHFHAKFAEYEVVIQIGTQNIYAGELPRQQLGLVFKWAELHAKELMNNWELARQGLPLKQIDPLAKK